MDLRSRWLDLGQAWIDDPAFVQLRDVAQFADKCGYCEYRKGCGGCRARGLSSGGSRLAPDSACEHTPRRAARSRPLVLIKVALDQPDEQAALCAPDVEVVVALASSIARAGLAPRIIAGHRGASEAVQTWLDRLRKACPGGQASPWGIDLQRAEISALAQGEEPDPARPILDFDHIITVAAIRAAPHFAAGQTATCLLPEPQAASLAASLHGLSERQLHGAAERHLAEQGIHGLAVTTPDGATMLLDHTVSSGAWILQHGEDGLLLGGTRAAALDRAAWEVLEVEPPARQAQDAARTEKPSPHPRATRPVRSPPGGTGRTPGPAGPPVLRTRQPGTSLTILGLSMTTQQCHAAALLRDGEIVGAAEEERFRRRKRYGWSPPGRPGVTAMADPTITIDEALPARSVAAVLAAGGLTLDDVDIIAVNGVHGRFRNTYSAMEAGRWPQIIRSGRVLFIPHHLAHAASAWRVSGMDEAVVFTVDGSGERETAAFFDTDGGRLLRRFDVPTGREGLIGGVYETVTRLLGFGPHGQGSTMGLAAMGKPTLPMDELLGLDADGLPIIHQDRVWARYGGLSRGWSDPLTEEHIALAASVQDALERVVIGQIERGLDGRSTTSLCMAGGVALNCSMNARIRRYFGIGEMFVQAAAHDAGTALGAALEAHFQVTGETPSAQMPHAMIGPGQTDAQIADALARCQLPAERSDDIATAVAERLAAGEVVCWYQGNAAFGPRALGGRSILADPRRGEIKQRLNVMKGRQWWRPLGPSILAGREADYFDDPACSPFMLFTDRVRAEHRDELPAILHLDGTTRPQSVDAAHQPRYHALISAFEKLTGVPMVVNTSFNSAWEPIVNRPEEAIATFLQLGADHLAIGDHLVQRGDVLGLTRPISAAQPARQTAPAAVEESKPSAPQPRRLMLRLTARCNCVCDHCTIADLPDKAERSANKALAEMNRGRRQGCTELVVMRGEATLRKDLLPLIRRARAMGYRHIQLQTNARMLSHAVYVDKLMQAGVDLFEVSFFGPNPAVHDRIAGDEGAFGQTVLGLRNIVDRGGGLLVTVPVIRRNFALLPAITRLLAELGVKRLQYDFARPIKRGRDWNVATLARLEDAAAFIRRAVLLAGELDMVASTEAVPLCLLGDEAAHAVEQVGMLGAFQTADLHRREASLAAHRIESRPTGQICQQCPVSERCPTTWAAYQELFGTAAFSPVAAATP